MIDSTGALRSDAARSAFKSAHEAYRRVRSFSSAFAIAVSSVRGIAGSISPGRGGISFMIL